MNTTPMPLQVRRPMTMLAVPMALSLAACAATNGDAANASATSATAAPAAAVPAPSVAPKHAGPSPLKSSGVPAAGRGRARISGAIRDGNRSPPALRVCATPINGGTPTCIQTVAGAREYSIEVRPGRYYLMGWAGSGELALIAHASQIRCIRAPCPPDALIEVGVAAGQQRDGIDLNGSYVEIPDSWPRRPS